jgi:chemotaxis protein histidine kinase CheA
MLCHTKTQVGGCLTEGQRQQHLNEQSSNDTLYLARCAKAEVERPTKAELSTWLLRDWLRWVGERYDYAYALKVQHDVVVRLPLVLGALPLEPPPMFYWGRVVTTRGHRPRAGSRRALQTGDQVQEHEASYYNAVDAQAKPLTQAEAEAEGEAEVEVDAKIEMDAPAMEQAEVVKMPRETNVEAGGGAEHEASYYDAIDAQAKPLTQAEAEAEGEAAVAEENSKKADMEEVEQDAEEEMVEEAEEGMHLVVEEKTEQRMDAAAAAVKMAAEQAEVDAIVEQVVQEATRLATAHMDPAFYVMSSSVARWVATPPVPLLLPPGVTDEVRSASMQRCRRTSCQAVSVGWRRQWS